MTSQMIRTAKPTYGARWVWLLTTLSLVLLISLSITRVPALAQVSNDAAFQEFVEGLWPDARKHGISKTVFDHAFNGMTPDAAVIEKTRKQAEFRRSIGKYVSSVVSNDRIDKGHQKSKELTDLLSRIEKRFGVDRNIVLAIWGVETDFGGFTGGFPVVRALATLSYSGYRASFFRSELLIALRILQDGHVDLQNFNGSWAGAMGQTQFMPSSFMRYAVDFDGDGRKDIWTNVSDALASTAYYLKKHGWDSRHRWGFEVTVPAGYQTVERAALGYRPFNDWKLDRLASASEAPLIENGVSALLVPASTTGPKFLVSKNFSVIKTYNNSDAYALSVAILADRISGSSELIAPWPTDASQP